MQLDDRDIQILSMLSKDASLSHGVIGDAIGLSHSSVARRIAHMRKAKIISGTYADVSWDKLGLAVSAIALIKRRRDIPKEDVWSFLERQPYVTHCRLVTGPYDLVAEILAPSLEEYGRFVSEQLLSDAGIETVESMMVLKSIKGPPVDIRGIMKDY